MPPSTHAAGLPPRLARPADAFSLIELLLAILLIIILAFLLTGATMRVRDTAERTACVNHLRTFAHAILADAAEQNHTFLHPGYEKGVNPSLWNYILHNRNQLPFEVQRRLYCPALRRSALLMGGIPESEWVAVGHLNTVGYSYNFWLARKRQPSLTQPAKTMLLLEGNLGVPVAYGKLPRDRYAYRHRSMMNIAYCDGHVSPWEQSTPLPPVDDIFWAYPALP